MPTQSLTLAQRPAFAARFSDGNRALVSTYQLDQKEASRAGSLCIVSLEDGRLSLEKTIPTTAGVFRFEWRNAQTSIAALTDGTLAINRLSDTFTSDTIPVTSNMLLDVSQSDSSLTGATDDRGNAYVVDLDTSTVVASWAAHSLPYATDDKCEVWTCAITKDSSVMATGADDGLLKLWDTRSRTSIGHFKLFDAGVTFVEWTSDDLLTTGSYDEHVRLLDRRQPRQEVKKTKLHGGVWNLSHFTAESGQKRCVAACMYGGYAVLDDEDLSILEENEAAGGQLLYGATWMGQGILYTTFNDYKVGYETCE